MWKALAVITLCLSAFNVKDVLAEIRVKSSIPAGKSKPVDMLVMDPEDLTLKPTVGTHFSCKVIHSQSVPTSVHRLRPSDIKVVAGMGDSITAALGARASTLFSIAVEFRGISWSIGGDKTLKEVETLPNILKHFNPNLVGFSTGIGPVSFKNSHLNVAESGAEADRLVGQVDKLVKRMVKDPKIDFANDWKVITLWIGANDQCLWCAGSNVTESEAQYVKRVRNALNRIRANIPRVFVNMVQILDVTVVHSVTTGLCDTLHKFECPCATSDKESVLASTKRLARKFQRGLRALVDEYANAYNDQFAVTLQPFLENFEIPKTPNGKPDITLFAPDCFHFSPKAHAAAASALWNNMMTPVGKKVQSWAATGPLVCPTEEFPYLATAKNSKKARRQSRPITINAEHPEKEAYVF